LLYALLNAKSFRQGSLNVFRTLILACHSFWTSFFDDARERIFEAVALLQFTSLTLTKRVHQV
jgi:hypothetical protein